MKKIQQLNKTGFRRLININIFLFFVLLSTNSFGNYIAKHQNYIKELTPLINNILVSNGLCEDKLDCNKKTFLLYGAGKNRLYITMYSINSLDIVQNIINIILEKNKSLNEAYPLTLEIYKNKHLVNLDFFFSFFTKTEPFLIFTINEK